MVREPRTTADADAVVFVSIAEAEVLIRQAAEAGFEVREDVERQGLASTGTIRLRRGCFQIDLIEGVARRHGDRFDVSYLERTLRPVCELAEDMGPWNRLRRVLDIVRS